MKRPYEKPTVERRGRLTAVTAGKPTSGVPVPSDLRLKTHVVRSGTTDTGLPLYQYRYLGSSAVFEGVMAQDVLQVCPAAVGIGETGFYEVDYELLGLTLRRVT